MAAIPSPGKEGTGTGILQSTLSPKYLHTNSTSHTWPFSAIAELIDNAYDPDVKASQLWIDKLYIRSKTCLSFTDNGNGMTPEKLHKMLSFGFCEKVPEEGHMPVGHYGNGFKSGSMRLGKDALVFTKQDSSQSVGYLSQTYLEIIKADTVLVPIVTWDKKPDLVMQPNGQKALEDILKYSLFRSQEELKEQFNLIPGHQGTRIIISNIRKTADNKPEFDFFSDEHDIRIPDDANTEGGKYRQTKRQNHIPECDYSLRAYCAILYLKPRMQIILRGKKVKTLVVEKSLSKTEVDRYKPQALADPVKVVFGFNSRNKNHYGIMMYHRNRLIKPYERVGHQLKPNNLGVGVVGVVQCDFLQPTHNKQDFDYTKAYRACMSALGIKLNEYWNEKKGLARSGTNNQPIPEPQELQSLPDQTWVQCDKPSCLKWRKLPDGVDPDSLPDKWYCFMNPDEKYKSCDVPEEKDDDPSIIQPYAKVQKKRLEKELQERTRREKEAKIALEIQQEKKKRQLLQKEEELKQKEDQLNKQMAVLQESKPKIKVEGMSKLPTAQVLPRPTMVKVSKPFNAVSPSANQSSGRFNQSVSSPARNSQSTPRVTIVSESTLRSTKSNQSVSANSNPSVQITTVKPKPVEVAPSSLKPVANAGPGKVDSSRGTFKVMKFPDGNAFLVQQKGGQVVDKKPIISSSPFARTAASTATTTQKVVAVGMSSYASSFSNLNKHSLVPSAKAVKDVSRNTGVNVKPRLSVVLPKSKPQAPASCPALGRGSVTVNDRYCYIVPTAQQQSKSPASTTATSTGSSPVTGLKSTATNVNHSPSTPTSSLPKIVYAISTAITSQAEEKNISHPGVKRESQNHLSCPIPNKTPKKVDDVIVIDDPSPVSASQPETMTAHVSDARITHLEAEFKEKVNKLQLQLDEKTNQLNEKTKEVDQSKNELHEKTNELNTKGNQLKSLRANVCRLLQVLVPEIEVDCEQESGDGETVDELLKQVLEANQKSE